MDAIERIIEKAFDEGGDAAKRENLWRYPSRGELPETDGFYLVTIGNSVETIYWSESKWHEGKWGGVPWKESRVRAWRERPEPAPGLEEEIS